MWIFSQEKFGYGLHYYPQSIEEEYRVLAFWETYLLEVINKKRKGILPATIRAILWTASLGYRFGSAWYHLVFDQGWRRRYYPPVPLVISVGNIVAGGTGKTPLIVKLAKELSQKYPIAILSRGYRSPAEHLSTPIILSQGRGPLYPSSYCGDEPYMISENVPDASLFVGRNRRKSSIMAAKGGARLILLDDGMQYRQLARDVEIVIVNAHDPFGLGYFLPRGRLRESIHGLKRADYIIINHAYDRTQYNTAKHQISRFSSAPIIAMRPKLLGTRALNGNDPHAIKGKKIGIFSGIGAPELFRVLLQTYEACIVAENIVADHATINQKELERYAHLCAQRGAEFLVCTEKDKVKLSENVDLPLPILWAQMDLEIVEGEEHWDKLLQNVRTRLDKMPVLQGV